MIYLLDTNILAEPVRPAPDTQVMDHITRHSRELATSTINWHEMLFGLRRMPASRRRDSLQRYLFQTLQATLPILAYDEPAAHWHAEERARLSSIGKPPSFADAQIAAIAATQNLILVTRNIRDFEHFQGLEIENWFGE